MEQEFLLLLKLFLTGIFLGLLYDCLRIWRSVMTNSRFWIDLQDLIYWSSAGLFVFYVIYMENNGQIRLRIGWNGSRSSFLLCDNKQMDCETVWIFIVENRNFIWNLADSSTQGKKKVEIMY